MSFGGEFFFGGGPETMDKQDRTNCGKDSLRNLGAIPKSRQTKIKNAPQIHSAEPRGQYAGPATTQNLAMKFDGEICGGVLGGKCFWRFSHQKKLENLLPNFAGSSPPISENFADFTPEIPGA